MEGNPELIGYPTYTPFWDTRPYARERANYSTLVGNQQIRDLTLAALLRDQDPNEVLAMAMGESTMGQWDDAKNPLHLFLPLHQSMSERISAATGYPEFTSLDRASRTTALPIPPKNNVDKALNYKWYLDNVRYPNNPDKALQAYQGLGVLTKGRDRWSGRTQNAGKTMPYVSKIKALRKALLDNIGVQMQVQRVKDNRKNK